MFLVFERRLTHRNLNPDHPAMPSYGCLAMIGELLVGVRGLANGRTFTEIGCPLYTFVKNSTLNVCLQQIQVFTK